MFAVLATSATGCTTEADSPRGPLVGTWGAQQFPEDPRYPDSQAQPPNPLARLTFNPDGNWSGTDGCNELSGEYDLEEDGSDFESAAGSIAGVGCIGGNVPWDRLLADTEKVVVKDDETLDLLSSGGDLIVRLSLEGEANGAIVMPTAANALPGTSVGGVLAVRTGCLTLDSMLVIWPYGATWAPWSDTVHVPGGHDARIGSRVYGEGGSRDLGLPLPASFGEDANASIKECQSQTGLSRLAVLYTVEPNLRPSRRTDK